MHTTTTHAHRPIRLLRTGQMPREVHKSNIAYRQQTRPLGRRVCTIILRNRRSRVSALHPKVREQDVPDIPPSTATRLVAALVTRSIDRDPRPGLDVGAVVHVLVAADDIDVIDDEVLDAGVFEVLADGAQGDAVAAVALDVASLDVVAAGFDGDAVVAALVYD